MYINYVISPKHMKQTIHIFKIAIYISLTVNICCYIVLSYMAPHNMGTPLKSHL